MTGKHVFCENDNELTVAVCACTYYKLNGYMPGIDELCSQLGSGYRTLVIQLLNRPAFVKACCA